MLSGREAQEASKGLKGKIRCETEDSEDESGSVTTFMSGPLVLTDPDNEYPGHPPRFVIPANTHGLSATMNNEKLFALIETGYTFASFPRSCVGMQTKRSKRVWYFHIKAGIQAL